jgi:hypothetical protein
LFGGVALAVLLLASACGGGNGDGEAPPEATSSDTGAGADSATSPAPGATTPPAATAASGGAAIAARSLPELNGYRYVFKLEGSAGLIAELSENPLPAGVNPNTGTLTFEIKGSYVKPDKGEFTIAYGGASESYVSIGRQGWVQTRGVWSMPAAITPDPSQYSFIAYFWDASPIEAISGLTCGSGREMINGVPTRKCSADKATLERLNASGDLFTFGALDVRSFTTATLEIWLLDNDRVIRLRSNLAGPDSINRNVVFKMELDISDINATNIAINPPR